MKRTQQIRKMISPTNAPAGTPPLHSVPNQRKYVAFHAAQAGMMDRSGCPRLWNVDSTVIVPFECFFVLRIIAL